MQELKLYQIPAFMRQALDNLEIDEETGEILNADGLHSIELSAKDKIANTARYIRECTVLLDAMKTAKQNIDARMKTLQKRIDYLAGLSLDGLQALGINKIEEPDIRIGTRKSVSTVIEDEETIPSKFVTIVQTEKINRTEIKKAIQAGEDVPGAHLVENINLSIK